MTEHEGSFASRRGDQLYYKQYIPAANPSAFLVWHHGYGAHATLAEKAFSRFRDAGISVFAYDATSFGRSAVSESARSLVLSKEDMPNDVVTFVEEVVSKQQPSPRVPVFLGGHSMGGMVTILSGIRNPELWQGIVTTSPAVDVARDLALKVLQLLQPLLLRLCPTARLIPAIPVDFNTPDPEVRQRLKDDPLVDLGNIRLRMGTTFLQSWAEIAAREQELQLPIYIAFSTTDKVVYAPAIERLLKNVQSKDVKVNRLSDAMHDLLLGPEEQSVSADIIEWVKDHS